MTATLWDQLHGIERHNLRYPSEHVVRFLAPLERGKLLDIGAGSGRHMVLAENLGFRAAGVDASMSAAIRLPGCVVGDMTMLPFRSEQFDVAVAYGVFYYGTRDQYLAGVHEMWRVLKPGGRALVVMRTTRDTRYLDGTSLNNTDRFIKEGDEAGMVITFLHETDIAGDFAAFSDLSYELTETTRRNRAWRDSDWLIKVTK